MIIRHKRPALAQAITIDGLQAVVGKVVTRSNTLSVKHAISALKDYLVPVINSHGRINVETGDVPELVVAQSPLLNPDSEWIEHELEDLKYARFSDVTGIEFNSSEEDWIDFAEIVVFGCIAIALQEAITPGLKFTISAGHEEVVSWIGAVA